MCPCEESGYIPSALYDQIKECMPIVSVEALIVIGGALLFLKRNNQPAKGEWWFPGGRIRKGESLENSLFREVREETELDVVSYRLTGVYSRVFPERHDITIAYLCKCSGNIKLNNEHSEYRLISQDFAGLNDYILETIRDSNWSTMR